MKVSFRGAMLLLIMTASLDALAQIRRLDVMGMVPASTSTEDCGCNSITKPAVGSMLGMARDIQAATATPRGLPATPSAERSNVPAKPAVQVASAKPKAPSYFVPRHVDNSGPRTFSASFYDPTGNATASGAPYNRMGLTAASANYPFGTWVRAIRKDDPTKFVDVCITDRLGEGRYKHTGIDLTPHAFSHLAPRSTGRLDVAVTKLADPPPNVPPAQACSARYASWQPQSSGPVEVAASRTRR